MNLTRIAVVAALFVSATAPAGYTAERDEQPKAKVVSATEVAAWSEEVEALDVGYKGEVAVWAAPDLDTTQWSPMDVPGIWEEKGYAGFDGVMWFRKTVAIPEAWAGKPLRVGLGAINDSDRVWFNGKLIGEHDRNEDWFNPRVYDVPAELVKAGPCVITVRVYDVGGNGGICGDPRDMWVKAGDSRASIPLAGPWKCKPGLEVRPE